MRVALDIQVCQSEEFRGIGRYSLDFAKAAVSQGIDAGQEMLAILNGEHLDRQAQIVVELGLRQSQYRTVWSSQLSLDQAINARFDSLFLNRMSSMDRCDVIHDSHVFEYPEKFALNFDPDTAHQVHTATFYDLIPMRMPEKYLPTKTIRDDYYRHVESLKRRDLLFAISEATRQDGIDLLKLPADRVVNISTGVDETLFFAKSLSREELEAIKAKFGISRNFLLYTTGFDPRKNLPRLVKAFAMLSKKIRNAYQLVIVCPRTDWSEPLISDLCRSTGMVDGKDVIFTGFVQDADLVALYRATSLFVFPSLYEGFGLPIVEAVRCGAPAIGSDCSSIVELLPDRDTRFDPTSAEDIAGHIASALENPSGLKQLQKRELAHVSQYTWDNVAKTAWQAWTEAIERKRHKRGSCLCSIGRLRPDADEDFRSFCAKLTKTAKESGVSDIAKIAQRTVLNGNCGDRQTRILFDISWWINADITTGIQRVVSKIAAAFRKRSDGFVYQAVALKDGKLWNCSYDESRGKYAYDGEWKCQSRDILLMLDSSWEWREAFLPFFGEIKAFGGRVYSVVYDILPVLQPELFDYGIRTIFPLWLRHASHHTDGIICISKSVAAEYCEYVRTRKDFLPVGKQFLVGHFYLGADFMSKNASCPAQVEFPFAKDARVILSVGTIEPRKNHVYMLDVMENVLSHNEKTCWVIVGQRGWFMEKWTESLQKHPMFGKRIFYYPKADDAQLSALYDRSEFLLNLSKGEGYGLPLIEAGEKGKHVICSDIPVFHEIDRFGYDYCPLDDAKAAAQVVIRALTKTNEVKTGTCASGSRFSWDDSAQMLMDCIVGNKWDRMVVIDKPVARECERRISGEGLKMDVRYQLAQPCDTDYVLGYGFGSREPWGVWCVSEKSEMTIRLPKAKDGKLQLRFTAQAFGDKLKSVDIFWAKKRLTTWKIQSSAAQEYVLDCSGLPDDREIDLVFDQHGVSRPCDMISGCEDARTLGIGLVAMELKKILKG